MRKNRFGIAPDGLAEHRDRALARPELAGDELHERALAGAVGPEQPGDAGRHVHRDVVQADDLAVPLRQVVGGEDRRAHATISTPRTRRSRTEIDTASRPSSTRTDTIDRRLVARRLPEDRRR